MKRWCSSCKTWRQPAQDGASCPSCLFDFPSYDKCREGPPPCVCTHEWENHHHGVVLNDAYPQEEHAVGYHGGVCAQECENDQHEGRPLVDVDVACSCASYKAAGDGKRAHGVLWYENGRFYVDSKKKQDDADFSTRAARSYELKPFDWMKLPDAASYIIVQKHWAHHKLSFRGMSRAGAVSLAKQRLLVEVLKHG